ncbi:MAG: GDSL-type esterase/lipase family protein [Propionibacteriaceae bacterium]|jgi:hypothetical protein|nr:GDSL-type esterase/lipase family protein [Propionibacteriaceae bacterium]
MSTLTTLGPQDLEPLIDGAVDTDIVDGALRTHRLAQPWRHQFPWGFTHLVEEQGSGVRLRFSTTASRLRLLVQSWRSAPVGAPEPSAQPFDLTCDGRVVSHGYADRHGIVRVDPVSGETRRGSAPTESVTFDLPPGGCGDATIWLPYAEITWLLGLEADAPVGPVHRSARPRWVHYGSSISHGAVAERPSAIWPVRAAARAGVELVNLGVSGNAVLDPFAARTIAAVPAGVISLKVGINIVNNDCLTARSFGPALHGFLDVLREAHPTAPILLITALHCGLVEDRPGPTYLGDDGRFATHGVGSDVRLGKLTLRRTRELIAAVAHTRADANLRVVDGLTLFGPADEATHALPDGLHPDGAAHELIAQRFAPRLAAALTSAALVPASSTL